METIEGVLEEIGLTKSEIKVYLALLKLGSSTKKNIVKEANIPPSRLYDLTNKLTQKGLVSYVKKNKVLHFSAAPPQQVLDFLQSKQNKIIQQKAKFVKALPQLKSLRLEEETPVEVFKGWKGMRTVYQMMINLHKPGSTNYVIGGTLGEDPEATARFFINMHQYRRNKKIIIKVLMNKKDRGYCKKVLCIPRYDKVKYMKNTAPSEVSIWSEYVLIVILTKTPVVTMIKNKAAADSFKDYFKQLWKIAKL